jgi:aspartyl-tRNA(Asn)/glutamyl-tRNA(Gln) amidotransferase subunit A
MTIDLKNLTIEKAHDSLMKGEFSVRELVDAYLKIIAEKNPDIHAYLEVYTDIDAQVSSAEKKFSDGSATILTGIPVALKDNMLFAGHIASASSKMLEDYTATYDCTVVSILKEQGVVFLGRTNMDEFAMGSSTENSAFGRTKNPLAPEYVPGGSSGGSAAAVAMDGVLIALGSDTGGSIRQPAAFCGIVGMKPTYGTVSRSGLMAMASSLDQIGPFAKTVRDAEIMFTAISSYDPLEATSVPLESRVLEASSFKLQDRRVGVPRDWLSGEGIDEEVKKNFEESLEKLKGLGYELIDIELPISRYSLTAYYILQPAEVSSNLARFDGIRYGHSNQEGNLLDVYEKSRGEGFGKEVRRRILLGTYILSHGYYDAYYGTAGVVRTQIENEFKKVFETVSVIVTPTSPFPPFKAGEKTEDPLAMYMSDLFTVPANIVGVPGIAIPSGKTDNGLPHSIQFMAPHFCEDRLFAIGKAFESAVQL